MDSTTSQTVEAEKLEQPLPAIPDVNKEGSSTKKVLSKFKPSSWRSISNSKPPLTNVNVNETSSSRRKSISSDVGNQDIQ